MTIRPALFSLACLAVAVLAAARVQALELSRLRAEAVCVPGDGQTAALSRRGRTVECAVTGWLGGRWVLIERRSWET